MGLCMHLTSQANATPRSLLLQFPYTAAPLRIGESIAKAQARP